MAEICSAAVARRHRQLRERAGRQEMLQRDAVVRALMGDREDDAGLPVGQPRHRDAGLPRAAASRGPRRPPPAGRRASGRPRCAPARRRRARHSAAAGANTETVRQRVQPRVDRHPQAARLHHPAERRRRRSPALVAASKCRYSREAGRPSRPSETRMSRIGPGRIRAAGPTARPASSTPARPGGDGVGAAVEIRVLHRRQRRAIDDGGRASPAAASRQASAPPTGPAPTTQTSTVIVSAMRQSPRPMSAHPKRSPATDGRPLPAIMQICPTIAQVRPLRARGTDFEGGNAGTPRLVPAGRDQRDAKHRGTGPRHEADHGDHQALQARRRARSADAAGRAGPDRVAR